MKEELMYQQMSQVLTSVNDGAPELFRQIILSGYIWNITGIILVILTFTTICVLIKAFEDEGYRAFPIVLSSIGAVLIAMLPIMNLVQIIITPKVYILSQLLH